MKFKVLVEYEYPIEHKIPVKAELILHGDRVVTDNIKWVEQEPREITLEDVKEYCKSRCLTIITNELLHELTHPKIKALEQEPFINKPCVSSGICEHDKQKVLNKIRAEIKQEYKVECENHYGQGLRRAIEIIDKYKAESEVEE